MIRINLLPLRASKKKETAVQQIVIFCTVLVVSAAVAMTLWGVWYFKVVNTNKEIESAKNKIKELDNKIGDLKNLKTLKEQVSSKLGVIAQLRRDKTGPAQRLATLSKKDQKDLPEELWLTGYSEAGDVVKISGFAYNEDMIANYMRYLEASSDYMNVELLVSEQNEVTGIKLKKFDLSMKLKKAAPPTPAAATPSAPVAPATPAAPAAKK